MIVARATKEQSEATAARIIEATRRQIADRGVDGLSLDDIAGAAGVTRGAVYHHYRSRQGLVAAALADAHREVGLAVERAAETAGDGWDGIEAGCRAFIAESAAPGIRRLMLVDGPAVVGWEQWRAFDALHAQASLAAGLAELQRAGELVDVDVDATAAMLSGAMNEAALYVGSHPDPGAALERIWVPLRLVLTALRR